MPTNKEPIGHLWTNRDPNKHTVVFGKIEIEGKKITIAVFNNHQKRKENDPDYIICETYSRPKSDGKGFGDLGENKFDTTNIDFKDIKFE